MQIPPSAHFTPLSLNAHYNARRSQLDPTLQPGPRLDPGHGVRAFRGLPFDLGSPDTNDVLLLDQEPIALQTEPFTATYLIFLHAVADRVTVYQEGLADFSVDGNELGDHVSDYQLTYVDGSTATVPILRRFAIQQSRIQWGASPFAAQPEKEWMVFPSATEAQQLERTTPYTYGRGETRHDSGRGGENLWLYALPNPHPEQAISQILLIPRQERSVIYAISHTQLPDHPLRPGVREKLRLSLPPGCQLNGLGELENVALDLGTVISARAALDYDIDRWLSLEPNVQPHRATDAVIVEYVAHPAAILYVMLPSGEPAAYPLADLERLGSDAPIQINPAHRPVRIRVLEKGGSRPVAARLHLHGEQGEYLPPKGYHRRVNPFWFEDNYGEFVNRLNQYAYITGDCVADLPLGTVYVEITRGYEITPIRTQVTISPETEELFFEVEKSLAWREAGWVTADTHVHFLSPTTALLEGQAEGVNVVNLLASQWGEMFSNTTDFDGKTTLGARDFGGDGEFLVRVGTENRMQVLGHISLLGYSGAMIHPLCSGGPGESAIGDAQEVTMAQWAQQCIDQGGLVVMPHGPNPQGERAADIVLGLINAMEMMTFNPHDAQINPYGIADWYRYLSLGYQVPICGGSDKMAAASLLGGVRTYAHLGGREFTYENWMAAVRAGNTFVTVGPLAEITVNGQVPGSTVTLTGPGQVEIGWRVESVRLPIEQVELVVGGLVVEQVNVGGKLAAAGNATVTISDSTWVALRVRGSYSGRLTDIAAHTSAVQVTVGGRPLFNQADASAVLDQIQGALAYVDTLAPRPDAQRYKQLRVTLEGAYTRLHQRLHNQGLFHRHTPLHSTHEQREH